MTYLPKVLDSLTGPVEYDIDGRPATREEFEAAHAAALLCRLRGWPCRCEVIDPRGAFLVGRSKNVYSQFGEDGLIEALFERIGAKNRWCFEVGAGDGVNLSNTKVLRDAGWSAVLIEADERLYQRMQDLFLAGPRIIPSPPGRLHWLNARVGAYDLDPILSHYNVPADLDLGVLDIDGQDFHVWDGLKKFRPRVMVVEFNQQDAEVPPLGGAGQAGLTAVVELGKAKGYVPLVRTNVNAIFTAEEVWA